MKSKSFLLLLICFLCFFNCKNTTKPIVAEKEKSASEPEIIISEKVHNSEKPVVNIELPKADDAINIPEKKVSKIVVKTEAENKPKQVSLPQVVKDEPKVDSRLKFKLEEVSNDELNAKICGLFETIEEKIIAEDFDGWYNSLSGNYRSFIEDPDELLKMSRKSGYLKRKKIVLRSAKDYFDYIVIPSREGIALKYVNFQRIDEKNIKVNCMLDGNTNFVYDFVYENESWKLDKK